jgi:AraC family transcriptional regulator
MIADTVESKLALPKWVEKIKVMVEVQYNQKLTLTMLSKEAGIHPMHLSRQFPKYFHVPLYYYVRQIKIEKATTMLYNKKYKLYEIAHQCGFTDPSHFNRCFRKIKGMNPSQYRKLIAT